MGPAVTPAIPVARGKGEVLPAEELRLRHRHLDLRRPELQRNIILRHRLMQATRRYFDALGFLEVETPILTKPTPEGARDYRNCQFMTPETRRTTHFFFTYLNNFEGRDHNTSRSLRDSLIGFITAARDAAVAAGAAAGHRARGRRTTSFPRASLPTR